MLLDDLRGALSITWKDVRAYYLKAANISWGILFPFAFILAFAIRDPGNLANLIPGSLALTLLFSTSSMEAIVITFERRIGALERLLLAPIHLYALLAGKILAGMVFGLATASVVLVAAATAFGAGSYHWLLLLLTMILSAATFSTIGAFVSVGAREVFEAQTLANVFSFPMMFLGGIVAPLASMPSVLRTIARALPLTYAVDAFQIAASGHVTVAAWLDLLVLAAFTGVTFLLALWILSRRLA